MVEVQTKAVIHHVATVCVIVREERNWVNGNVVSRGNLAA